jgi:cellulose synthase/poly-beta-1,6-N-acetylglucosamine synthase-like glycosyltransferase
MMLIYITAVLLLFYGVLILFYRAGWKETPVFSMPPAAADLKISVIIPARNEEENIGVLLHSLQKQNYPAALFEVIVVDDHSDDKTAEIAAAFPFVKVVKLQAGPVNSYKKKAIETGIGAATGELIVTTDADCIVPETWLSTMAAFKKTTKAVFIAAPVMLVYKNNFLQIFQALDFLVLQGITAASVQKKIHNMCNGANLAYERKIFYEVNGFSQIDHIASGDDMLLMQKMYTHQPGKICYMLAREAIVKTTAQPTWKSFFNQRIRWASKATHYNDIKIFSALFLVYFFNFSLLVLLITGCFYTYLLPAFIILLAVKIIIEYSFIYPVAVFYERKQLLKWFILFQPVHILYTVIAGWLGLFGRFEWKGRKVR